MYMYTFFLRLGDALLKGPNCIKKSMSLDAFMAIVWFSDLEALPMMHLATSLHPDRDQSKLTYEKNVAISEGNQMAGCLNKYQTRLHEIA